MPDGVRFYASDNAGIKAGVVRREFKRGGPNIYIGTLKDRIGELYLAVGADSWKKHGKQQVVQVQRSKRKVSR